MKSSILLLGLAALAGSCVSQGDSETRQAAAANRLISIDSAFDVHEVPVGSKQANEPEAGLVDYESGLLVHPDKLKLSQLLRSDADKHSELRRARVAELDREIAAADSLVQRLEALTGVVDDVAAYERKSMALYSVLETEGVLASDPRFAELAEDRKAVILALTELSRIHVEAVEVGAAIDWNATPEADTPESAAFEKHQTLEGAVYTRMAPNSNGGRNAFDAVEFTNVLNETALALQEQLARLQKAVDEKSPPAKLEIEAWLLRGNDRRPISIAPYMVVAGENRGPKSRRVGLPGKEDAERLRRGFEANAELSKAVNGLIDTLGNEEAKRKLLEGAAEQLRLAAERMRDRLLVDLKSIAESSQAAENVKVAAQALRDSLATLEGKVREVMKAPDPVAKLERALQLFEELQGEKLSELEKQFETLVTALNQASLDANTDFGKLAGRIKGSLSDEAKTLAGALRGLPGGADVSALIRSLKRLDELAHARGFSELKPGAVTRTALGLDAAVDGFIDLKNTEAEDQDDLSVTYRVTVNPDSKDERTEYVGSTALGVRKFGLYTTLKSQLLFYDQVGNGGSTFRAAPGIAYNFHYRPRSGHRFYDTVAPGIGVSVLSPSFEGAAELAIGLQATFFNDMFQAGFAYNISVDDDQGMFYFGLDLIGAFQGLQ